MNVKHERDIALSHARGFAKSGNSVWAQLWVDRANSFYTVSKRQVANVQKLLDKALATTSQF